MRISTKETHSLPPEQAWLDHNRRMMSSIIGDLPTFPEVTTDLAISAYKQVFWTNVHFENPIPISTERDYADLLPLRQPIGILCSYMQQAIRGHLPLVDSANSRSHSFQELTDNELDVRRQEASRAGDNDQLSACLSEINLRNPEIGIKHAAKLVSRMTQGAYQLDKIELLTPHQS